MSFHTIVDSLALCIQTRTPCLLEGPVGDGKTSLVEGIGEMFCDKQYTSIVALHDPPEYGGGQVPSDAVLDDKGQVVRPAVINQVPLEWVHRLGKAKRPLLFLDEFSNGAPATRAAVMRGVLEGVWGDAKIENLAVVVAQNPAHIAESGTELSAPMSNRFCHLPWDMPVEYWNAAHIAGFPMPTELPRLPEDWKAHEPWAKTLVASFAQVRPAVMKSMPDAASERGKPFPSFRSWTAAERLITACMAVGYGVSERGGNKKFVAHDTTTALLGGCVGAGAAGEFLTFVASLDLPDPELLLRTPKSLKVPDRGDQAFAVLTSVTSAVIGKFTVERWRAAWDVLAEAAKQQRADVACSCASSLLSVRPQGEKAPAALDHFMPLLKAAGLLRI